MLADVREAILQREGRAMLTRRILPWVGVVLAVLFAGRAVDELKGGELAEGLLFAFVSLWIAMSSVAMSLKKRRPK